jgi:hypothetical protein
MLNKYSVLALIGSASAATSPLPSANANYPRYATITASIPATDYTANHFTVKFSSTVDNGTNNAGPIRGYREGLVVFPTQTLTKAVQATQGSTCAVAAAATGTRTFYQTTATELGTNWVAITTTDATTSSNTVADGASWVICKNAEVVDATKCNGGPYFNFSAAATAADPKSKAIVNRIAFFYGQTGTLTTGSDQTAVPSNFFTMNSDILVASFYHATFSGTTDTVDGTKWCSTWINSLKKDGTVATITATNGLTGRSKCTWQFKTEDGTVGVTFKVTKAEFTKAYFNYIEWISTAGLGTAATLPSSADGSVYKIGTYATTGGEVWLNPATAGAPTSGSDWQNSAIAWNQRSASADPTVQTPGSMGPALFYPGLDGINKDKQYIAFDSYLAIATFNAKQKEINDFNTVANDYNSKRTTYDNAVTAENTRRGDLMKSTFEPAVALPSRPCPPTPPAGLSLFGGFELNAFVKTSPDAAYTTATLAKNNLTLANIGGSGQANPDAKFHTRSGYFIMAADGSAAAVAADLANAGHVQGLFGQGPATMPDNAAPFQWFTAATTNAPGTMITILPEAVTDTGLTGSLKITIDGKGKAWQALAISHPAPPGAPANPKNPPGAGVKLAAGFVAAAAVLASLY